MVAGRELGENKALVSRRQSLYWSVSPELGEEREALFVVRLGRVLNRRLVHYHVQVCQLPGSRAGVELSASLASSACIAASAPAVSPPNIRSIASYWAM
ncbi:hypothetical protein FOZG_17918 [Fusarium oxysporum Fo47]|uniref:Uncharacterized protein n=1 Tax=Fusarium oxysporum Fo47 TaxID=660027 RepID=W9JG45_FUSOX|nr:hypothetical protein FOZG_17918 [Fusarium oxysporum Fo47]